MENKINFYELAQKYRSVGWNVLPLTKFSKIPLTVNWKEFQNRMATDEEVATWFADPNVTGIGVITGKISGIVVLDEDLYKEGGLRVRVQTGMRARTARGGYHHYFRYVEPVKSSGFRKGVHVEIKADGGFIVLPPSRIQIEGTESEYVWEEKSLPEELLEITEEQLAPYRASDESVNIAEMSRASEGNRHNNLRSIALSLFRRLRKEEWGFVEEIIRYEASQFDPPHPLQDVERVILDAKNFIRNHPREEVDREIRNEWIQPRTLEEIAKERLMDRELEKIAPKTPWPELDRILKGFIPGHIYTLTGNTNVGKTALACNIANALAKQEKRTLYISLEPGIVLTDYLASVRHVKPFSELTDEDLVTTDPYIHVLVQQDVKSSQDLIRVLKNMSAIRYDLVVIDHIGYFVNSEHNYVQNQANVIKELAFLAKEQKTAVMMIAHLRKPGAKSKSDYVPTQDDISGSAAFKQDSTDVLIAYRKTRNDDEFSVQFVNEGALMVTKTKSGPNGVIRLFFQEGSAKIWSPEEAKQTAIGQAYLASMMQTSYQDAMKRSSRWGQPPEKDDDD